MSHAPAPDICPRCRGLIAQQLLESVAGFCLARDILCRRHKFPSHEFKILAKIRQMLFYDRFRPAVPALVGRAQGVAHTIQACFQIGSALQTRFRAAWRRGQFIFRTAFPAMSGLCHGRILIAGFSVCHLELSCLAPHKCGTKIVECPGKSLSQHKPSSEAADSHRLSCARPDVKLFFRQSPARSRPRN